MTFGAPSQRPDEPILAARRGLWLVIALYVLVSAVVWLNFDGTTRLKYSGDGESWYQPSVGLYLHGAFVYPETPDTPSIYRPPAYPVFAAAVFSIAGGPSPNAIAVGQIVLLLLVGLIFRSTVNDWLPGWGDFGMGLLIFNPNVLTIAQYVQSDTLFLFFVTIAMWAMLRYARGETGWRYAVLAGVALALACLTRPTAQFLILVLPLAFPLLDVVSGNAAMWRRGYLSVCVEQACFGERREQVLARRSPTPCIDTANHALALGHCLVGERAGDVSAVLDWLLGGAHGLSIDVARIHVMGNSAGGTTALYSAALDERITAVLASSCLGFVRDTMRMRGDAEGQNLVPGMLLWFELDDIVALCAPRPFVTVSARDDHIWPYDGAAVVVQSAKKAYAALNAPDAIVAVPAEGGHRFYPEVAWPAFEKLIAPQ